MTKQENLQKESEILDKELIEVLLAISVVAERIAKNICRLSHHDGVLSERFYYFDAGTHLLRK